MFGKFGYDIFGMRFLTFVFGHLAIIDNFVKQTEFFSCCRFRLFGGCLGCFFICHYGFLLNVGRGLQIPSHH
ncbi:membrane protein [Beggiatoa sp. SS]|nr:membrane protein [Beggiatoa sp. SS]